MPGEAIAHACDPFVVPALLAKYVANDELGGEKHGLMTGSIVRAELKSGSGSAERGHCSGVRGDAPGRSLLGTE
jgi:hypothetical protein